MKVKFKRVLLKISGESLIGSHGFGIDPDMLSYVAEQVKSTNDLGIQLSIVIGGGNIFRGISGGGFEIERTSADHMGMLATVLNSLALQADAIDSITDVIFIITGLIGIFFAQKKPNKKFPYGYYRSSCLL